MYVFVIMLIVIVVEFKIVFLLIYSDLCVYYLFLCVLILEKIVNYMFMLLK